MSKLRIAKAGIFAAIMFLFPATVETAGAQPLPNPGNSSTIVLGFDMWCLEIELLPEGRCEMRKPEDIKTYQQYRAMMERYQQERDAKARKEKEFTQRLQRDPTATARTGTGSLP